MKKIALLLWLLVSNVAFAGGGPLGIDHKLGYDNSGIWKRNIQLDLMYVMLAGEFAGGVVEGGETRLGRTFWQSIDASIISGISTEAGKLVFTRARPTQTNDPNKFFQGGSNYSFPSGEVGVVSAIVTPFVLEYREENPSVYALELLPLYDAIARMKVQGHWQTDVLAGFAIGTAAGFYSHRREKSFTLEVLPHGLMVGLRKKF